MSREPDAPLRIIQVVEAAGGGTGRHVVELSRALLERGHEVHVLFSPRRAEPWFEPALRELSGLRVATLSLRRAPHPGDAVALLALRRYWKRIGGADVIHGHSSKGGALACLTRLVGVRTRRVYTPHGLRTMDPALGPLARFAFGWTQRCVIALGCDALIAVSPQEQQHFRECRLRPGKSRIVVNAVPRAEWGDRETMRGRFDLRPDDVAVGFVGRFVHAKAPARMIDAFAAVQREHPFARLVMVGDGEFEETLRRSARQRLSPDSYRFPGPLPGISALPAFDVFVLPSLHEAMPYVLLEALAAGLPILATDVGGVPVVVEDGVNGYIVPNGDAAALARRLERLVGDSGLRSRMRAAALARVPEFAAETMIRKTLAFYRGEADAP